MKANVVFSISEGMIKFLQVTGTQKKVVSGVDVIDTRRQSDLEISRTLSAFIKRSKLSFAESRVTVVIPRSRAILRYMTFPSQKTEEIRSMIDLQVGSQIPYVREEVEMDFQVLSKTADGYTKVGIVIIPKDVAMRYWKIFSDAKIPVSQMTISSIGLWLLYRQQPDVSERLGGIIDLDVDHSEICLCDKTHWSASREIPIGQKQIKENGYVEFLKQWELTQNSISGEKSSATVDPVYLVSLMKGPSALGIEMAKVRKLTVKDLLLTQVLPVARGVVYPKLLTQEGVSVASLAGIAFDPEIPPIDLIPQVVKQIEKRGVYRRQMIVLGIWVAAALISLGLTLSIGFFKKNVQLARLEDQLHDAKSQADRVKRQLQKVYDIEGMFKDRLIFADLAGEIDRLLPSQIALVSVNISDGHALSLQGISMNPADINQFQKAMVDSPRFSNVNLDYVNKRLTQQGEVDYFKITSVIRSMDREK